MVPLIDPINNLRRHLYSFTTDIEAFFHTIGVDERDRGAFRFLWFNDERMLNLREYLFLAFIFGLSASSSVTSYVLKTHGKRIREDDGSGGANSIEKCKKLASDLEAAMAKGGFKLAKWKYIHPQLRRDDEEEQEEQSILGISWNTKEDTLSVTIDEARFAVRATTPRLIVQQQAALFDPIGICTLFILLGRQWTQKSMVKPWGWDMKLKGEIEEGSNRWTESISLLKEVSVKRSWNSEETVGRESETTRFR